MEGVLGPRNFRDMRLAMERVFEHEVHEQRNLEVRNLEWEDLRKRGGIGIS